MAKKKRETAPPEKMKKPPFKIGDTVTVTFLTADYVCKILELKKNGERWIYKAQSIHDGTKYVHIGINGSERFANIWDRSKENLDNTNE
jgi:hypothetical protein